MPLYTTGDDKSTLLAVFEPVATVCCDGVEAIESSGVTKRGRVTEIGVTANSP